MNDLAETLLADWFYAQQRYEKADRALASATHPAGGASRIISEFQFPELLKEYRSTKGRLNEVKENVERFLNERK